MTSRRGILAALEEASDLLSGEASDFVSGEALASKLGISRAAVWKHIAALKASGYEIEGVRARGYRLVASPSSLSPSAIRARCPDGRLGRRIVSLEVTRSTNSDAMALGREGEPEGTVVLAEEQTAGRGRLGRTWESSRGVNLYASILLRPGVEPHKAPQLSLLAGVAVAETVCEEGVEAGIKWPNDVVVPRVSADGSTTLVKLAGILTEIEAEADRVSFVVVGIGVNLNSERAHFSPELADRATSVLLESGHKVDRTAFTARLLIRFEECYDAWLAGGFAAVAPRWRSKSVLEGRALVVTSPGEEFRGTCAGIDDDGALLVDTGEPSPRRVLAGDVTISGGYVPCHP